MTTLTTPTLTTPIPPITPRRASVIAGIGYVVIFVLAIFANFVVVGGMVDTTDAAATFTNITDADMMFRLGTIGFLVVFIADVVIAWALWIVFRGVNVELSRLAAWSRLAYTVFLGVALVFFFTVLELISDASWLTAFDQGQIEAQTMLALGAFDAAWLIGLAMFGLHLLVIGYLIVTSGVAPRALGIVLAIAGAAYIIDTVAHGVIAGYDDYANVFLALVAIPSVIGELWFTFWLLLRGGKEHEAIA